VTGLIVQDWIEPLGGAEKVLIALLDAFPDAHVRALWNDNSKMFPMATQSWIAQTPFRGHKALAMPLMPATWRHMNGKASYDWLLANSHLFAHHARLARARSVPKFVYCQTPARYLWVPEVDQRGRSLPARAVAPVLRSLDRRRAAEHLQIAANSRFVKRRILQCWDLDARVLYPPVDVEEIRATPSWRSVCDGEEQRILDALPHRFLFGASRFIPYKRLDLAIKAGEAVELPVVIAGSGPQHGALAQLAASARTEVTLVHSPSDRLLRALFQMCTVYIFPPIEDFGIMPVEAMACGAPTIVNALGGAGESVELCQGGVRISDWSTAGLREAIITALQIDRRGLPERTTPFSRSRFRREVRSWIQNGLAG
jgi:glycosyltransferase involved in cell wall biosynthesis